MKKCKCGSEPKPAAKVKGLKDGYVIRCSNTECHTVTQRVGLAKCQNSWDELASATT